MDVVIVGMVGRSLSIALIAALSNIGATVLDTEPITTDELQHVNGLALALLQNPGLMVSESSTPLEPVDREHVGLIKVMGKSNKAVINLPHSEAQNFGFCLLPTF